MTAVRSLLRNPLRPIAKDILRPIFRGHGGGIPDPSLALLFSDGEFDPRITFTRASQATYTDALGRIRLAENNVPRIDYDPITGAARGLLMERAATNRAPQSGNPGAWESVGGAVLTPLPPEGVFTPARVASAGDFFHRAEVVFGSVSQGDQLTITMFYKPGTSGSARVGVTQIGGGTSNAVGPIGSLAPSATGAGGVTVLKDAPLDASGLRVATILWTASEGGDYRVGGGPQSNIPGEDIIIYGIQAETGTVATSYIPTAGSPATRAADSAVVADLSDWYNSEQGTLLIEAIPGPAFPNTADLASLVDSVGGSNDNRLQVFKTSGGSISFYAAGQGSGIPTISTGAFDPDAVVRFAFTYPLPTTIYRDGQVYGPTVGIPEPTITGLNIGGRGAGTQPGGVIRKILYFPRRLSDEQLRALTS